MVHLLSKGNLLDKGYNLNMDNYYCSVRLNEYLSTRNTGMRGTIRENRGVPSELRRITQQPISSKYMRKDDILVVKFTDKKHVYFISSIEEAGEISKTRVLPGNRRIEYI